MIGVSKVFLMGRLRFFLGQKQTFRSAIGLTLLAPDIVSAILSGKQSSDLTARKLLNNMRLPPDWNEQRRCLGFA
jgi:hypothetical protein